MAKKMTEKYKKYLRDYYQENKERYKKQIKPKYQDRMDNQVKNEVNPKYYIDETLCTLNYTDKERRIRAERKSTERWNKTKEYNQNVEVLFVGKATPQELAKIFKYKL